MALLPAVRHGRRFHGAVSPVPNQTVHRKFRSTRGRGACVKRDQFIWTHPDTDRVVGKWRRAHQRNASLWVGTWRHAKHLSHPSYVPTSGVVVDVERKRHASRGVVNRGGDADPHERVSCPNADEVCRRAVAVVGQEHVVVVGVGVRLEVKRQEVDLDRVTWRARAQGDGVILVAVGVLGVRRPAVVVGEENGVSCVAIHRVGSSFGNGDKNLPLGPTFCHAEAERQGKHNTQRRIHHGQFNSA